MSQGRSRFGGEERVHYSSAGSGDRSGFDSIYISFLLFGVGLTAARGIMCQSRRLSLDPSIVSLGAGTLKLTYHSYLSTVAE
jgi:hypothetical protein